jgi:hypothetical protein
MMRNSRACLRDIAISIICSLEDMNLNTVDTKALRGFLKESPRNRDIFRKFPIQQYDNPMKSRRPLSEALSSAATRLWKVAVGLGIQKPALSIQLAATSLIMDLLKPAVEPADVRFMREIALKALSDSSKSLITDAYIVLSNIGLINQDLKSATMKASLALEGPDSYFENDSRRVAVLVHRSAVYGFQKLYPMAIIDLDEALSLEPMHIAARSARAMSLFQVILILTQKIEKYAESLSEIVRFVELHKTIHRSHVDLCYVACVIISRGKVVDKKKKEEAREWFKKGNEALVAFPQESNFKGLCEMYFLNSPKMAGDRECYKCAKISDTPKMCGKCKVAVYCSKECQIAVRKSSHVLGLVRRLGPS